MSNQIRKLPPEVWRELRRHVSPKPLKSPLHEQPAPPSGSKAVLYGVLALTATAASFPLVAHWWISEKESLSERDQALTAAQIRRGAFLNSGTRDMGKDPNWDFRNGQYKQPTGYAALPESKLPVDYMVLGADQLNKHEENMKAFATGKRNIDGRQKAP